MKNLSNVGKGKRFPIGVFKHVPADPESLAMDDSATIKVIDMDYFVESPNTKTWICKIDNEHYPFELFKKFESFQLGVVYALSDYARSIGITPN